MKDLRQFNIQFVGLKEGEHKYKYSIEKEFFELFNYDEFLSSEVKIDLSLVKKTTLLELTFSSSGYVELPCDITNELFDTSKPMVPFISTLTTPYISEAGQQAIDLKSGLGIMSSKL